MALTNRQLTAIVEFLPRLYALHNVATFAHHVVATLHTLIRSESIGYNDLNVRAGRVYAVVEPLHASSVELYPVFGQRIHEHPVINYQQSTGDTRALRLSDFVSQRRFHHLGIYQDFYRKLGIERMVSLSFPDGASGDQLALVFARDRTDFSDEEMEVVNLLRPHFLQAHRNAIAFSRLEQANEAFQSSSRCMIVRCHGGSIRFASPRASRLLAIYFAEKSGCDRSLPDELNSWARRCMELSATMRSIPVPCEPFIKNGINGKLIVRFLPGPGKDYALIIEEHPVATGGERLVELGLSERQAEVLHWIARGKTNAEIAAILGVRSRTIDKHVEHIFDRLGVETRMAAGAIAWKTLGSICAEI
jgi:DNA-binding CsgD family transcriptional regulator